MKNQMLTEPQGDLAWLQDHHQDTWVAPLVRYPDRLWYALYQHPATVGSGSWEHWTNVSDKVVSYLHPEDGERP